MSNQQRNFLDLTEDTEEDNVSVISQILLTQEVNIITKEEEDEWLEIMNVHFPDDDRLNRRTTLNKTPQTKEKARPKCSFCKTEGHNIRQCESETRFWILENIELYVDVKGGRYPAATTSEDHVKFALRNELIINTIPELTMYCMILRIRAPKTKSDLVETVHTEMMRIRTIRLEDFQRQEFVNYRYRVNTILELHTIVMRLEKEYARTRDASVLEDVLAKNRLMFEKMDEFRSTYEFETYQDLRRQILENEKRFKLSIPVKSIVLKGNVVKPFENTECPICYESFGSEDVCMTQCSHTFCVPCISKSVKTDAEQRCPCCRTKIMELTNYTEKEDGARLESISCL